MGGRGGGSLNLEILRAGRGAQAVLEIQVEGGGGGQKTMRSVGGGGFFLE